jgi:hypothetical protein
MRRSSLRPIDAPAQNGAANRIAGSLAMIRAVLLTMALLLLTSCNRGDFGNLEPVVGGEVERGEKSHMATVRSGPVSAEVNARWASEASQSAEIIYTNEGKTAVTILLPRLVLQTRLGDAPLWAASDITKLDYKDNRTDNDEAPILYELEDGTEATGRMTLQPGERRRLSLGFTYLPKRGDDRIGVGDRVTMTVPLGRRDIMVPFQVK